MKSLKIFIAFVLLVSGLYAQVNTEKDMRIISLNTRKCIHLSGELAQFDLMAVFKVFDHQKGIGK